MDTRLDLILAAIVAAFGIAVIAGAMAIPDGLYRDAVGPRAVPIFIGFLMLVCGGLSTWRRAIRMAPGAGWQVHADGTEDEPDLPASLARAVAIMALTVAYTAVFNPLGYLLATPVYVAAALWVMQERKLGAMVAISVLWTVGTWVLFSQVLAVRIPVGPLRTLFREWGLIIL
jgi:putative tricarboxylic transport membrane protein